MLPISEIHILGFTDFLGFQFSYICVESVHDKGMTSFKD